MYTYPTNAFQIRMNLKGERDLKREWDLKIERAIRNEHNGLIGLFEKGTIC